MARYFGVSNHLAQLGIGLYMLGFGVGQLFLGVLSDSYGRRLIFILSALCFTLASFAVVFYTPTIYALNTYRFIQGLCLAGLSTLCRTMATDCYSGLALNKALLLITTSYALGPILGPFIGADLQYHFGWHAGFYFFGCYGAVIVLLTLIKLPVTHQTRQPFHYVVVVATMKSIIFHPTCILHSLLVSLIYGVIIVFGVVAPFLVETVLGYSVLSYGYMALALGISFFLGNVTSRVAIDYVNPIKLANAAMLAILGVSLVMIPLCLSVPVNLWLIVVPAAVIFYLCGLSFPHFMARNMGLFPQVAGTASAIFGTLLGVTVFGVTYLASCVKAESLVQLWLIYLGMIVVCCGLQWACYCLAQKHETVIKAVALNNLCTRLLNKIDNY